MYKTVLGFYDWNFWNIWGTELFSLMPVALMFGTEYTEFHGTSLYLRQNTARALASLALTESHGTISRNVDNIRDVNV